MANMIVDNSSLQAGTDEIRSGLWRGIRADFTYLESIIAGSIEVYVKRVGNPGDLQIKFYDLNQSTAIPVGDALHSFVLPQDSAVEGVFDWYTINLEELELPGAWYAWGVVLQSELDSETSYWETTDAYLYPGLSWTDGSGWITGQFGPAMIIWDNEAAPIRSSAETDPIILTITANPYRYNIFNMQLDIDRSN